MASLFSFKVNLIDLCSNVLPTLTPEEMVSFLPHQLHRSFVISVHSTLFKLELCTEKLSHVAWQSYEMFFFTFLIKGVFPPEK